MQKDLIKKIALVLSVILISFSLFFKDLGQTNIEAVNIDFSDFVKEIRKENIKNVTVEGNNISGILKTGAKFLTTAPHQHYTWVSDLIEYDVKLKVVSQQYSLIETFFINILMHWLPYIIIGIFFFRQNLFRRFKKASSKLENEKTTFMDVAGADEAKEDLKEVVEFLKNPKKFEKLGARVPKGVLLSGAPGTGKTLLARAVAGESQCAFYSVAGSEFVEMFVGVGASRVRALFEQAKQSLPAIIFIDEIDAIGLKRNVRMGNDERDQTLNELLVQIDGFAQNNGLIVFAATNRPDVLDPALTRSGRFDRLISVELPDLKQREAILNVHAKKIKLAKNVNMNTIAKGTVNFSGADLETIINEAALIASKHNQKSVTLKNLEAALDKVWLGSERKSMNICEKEKKMTAYHEIGHAIVAHYSKNSDPIHKVSIIPRGRALGMVVQLPEKDFVSISKIKLIEKIRVAMAGRAAEEEFFGKDFITTGASSDIEAATKIAQAMIYKFGMSKCGMRNFDSEGFLGKSSELSQEVMNKLDAEINELLTDGYKFAQDLIKEKKDEIELLVSKLLEKETLTGDEVKKLLEPKKEKVQEKDD